MNKKPFFYITSIFLAFISIAASANSVPTGHFEFTFDEPRIWEISETFNESFDGINVNYTVSTDEKGKINGSGSATLNDFGFILDADMDLKGKIRLVRDVTRFTLKLKMIGEVSTFSESFPFKGNINVKYEIDKATNTAIGTGKGKVCVKSLGCEKLVDDFSFALPAGMDGGWMLSLDLTDEGKNKIGGTGVITLANNREIHANITGKYSSKKETAKIKFKSDLGSKLNMSTMVDGMVLEILKLRGKALGQKTNVN